MIYLARTTLAISQGGGLCRILRYTLRLVLTSTRLASRHEFVLKKMVYDDNNILYISLSWVLRTRFRFFIAIG